MYLTDTALCTRSFSGYAKTEKIQTSWWEDVEEIVVNDK